MGTPKVTRAELLMQLQNAVALRNGQDQVLWTIVGFFGASNAVLLAGLFQSGQFPANPWVPTILIAAAIVLCAAWSEIQRRAIGHIARHERVMYELEIALALPVRFTISKINLDLHGQSLRGGMPARVVIGRMGLATMVLWCVVALLSVLHYSGLIRGAV